MQSSADMSQKLLTHDVPRRSMKSAQITRLLAPPPDAIRRFRVSLCPRSVIQCPTPKLMSCLAVSKSIVELAREVAKHVAHVPPRSQEHKVLPPNISVAMHDHLSISPRSTSSMTHVGFLNVARQGQSCFTCNVKACVAMSCGGELSHFPIGTIQVATSGSPSSPLLFIGTSVRA